MSNRYVREHGMYLRRRMYKTFNPIETREEALEIESEIAEALREKGHAVWYRP